MELIYKHLDTTKVTNIEKGIDTVCCLSGVQTTEGVNKKNILKHRFTDWEYVKYNSEYLSVGAAALFTIGAVKGASPKSSLRNYSFVATEKELQIVQREDILDKILNPPEAPFYFCVTFNFKKHISFKSRLNYDTDLFYIMTDKGECRIDRNEVKEIVNLIQRWYTVVPEKADTKAQPTHFTKKEILQGCNNYKRIEEYGTKFFEENEKISKYRRTLLLELLTYLLNKKEQ